MSAGGALKREKWVLCTSGPDVCLMSSDSSCVGNCLVIYSSKKSYICPVWKKQENIQNVKLLFAQKLTSSGCPPFVNMKIR